MSKPLRCAIYARKSSEEGLDQNFNSLDAQCEACAAYILSQAGEGWVAFGAPYVDGGFSGGTMERPALALLLADVKAGKIDVVVVYKVDRLTRALADFARIVEILDRAGASFVSVTQAFNTTTSMGRLTLNVLLSFAQFEREVTGERIRDKVAASKAKGLWMGGNPPLGYDVRERALQVNPSEAALVGEIFQRYLGERSVFDLRDALNREGRRTKLWTARSGRIIGGAPFSHGALYYLLSNRIYLGEVNHRGRTHPGLHEPIIAQDVFDAVQKKLSAGAVRSGAQACIGYTPLLRGRVFDDADAPMTPTYTAKGNRRYCYYVSTALLAKKPAGSLPRVSVQRLETLVVRTLAPLLARNFKPDARLEERAAKALTRVMLAADRLTLHVHPLALADDAQSRGAEQTGDGWRIVVGHTLAPSRHDRAILSTDATAPPRPPQTDRLLVKAIVLARLWVDQLMAGKADLAVLAADHSIDPKYARRLLPLGFLAPDLVEMILDGRQPQRLSLRALLHADLPLSFEGQRALFRAHQ